MKYLLFTLSMPGNNSWNGKWSGNEQFFGIIRSFREKNRENFEKILKNGYYTYAFGDGWVAGISIKELSAKELRTTRKKIKGFCGYDWMVDSIINNGTIKPSS